MIDFQLLVVRGGSAKSVQKDQRCLDVHIKFLHKMFTTFKQANTFKIKLGLI